jgi:hypothetical protein
MVEATKCGGIAPYDAAQKRLEWMVTNIQVGSYIEGHACDTARNSGSYWRLSVIGEVMDDAMTMYAIETLAIYTRARIDQVFTL